MLRANHSVSMHRRVWGLAWPMILSNVTQPLLGLVDTAILGHLESAHFLAAVAVGASILAFLYWAFGFLRMGTTGLTAQALGRQAVPELWLILGRATLLAFMLGSGLLLMSAPLSHLAVTLMSPGEQVASLAVSYCQIRLFSAPAALVGYAIIGWHIGRQDTRVPLLLLTVTNALNVVLDLLLIIGLGMQSDGAALATVIAEYCGLAIALTIVLRHARREGIAWMPELLSRPSDYVELLRVNRHLFVRTVCLLFSFAFFTAQGARMGDAIVAANAVLLNLLFLTAYGLDGFAHAVEALVGEAVGAARRADFDAAVRSCAAWSLATALLFTLLFLSGRNWLPGLFTDVPEVLAQLRQYYAWLVALPLLAVASYLLDGIFIGATRTVAMQHSMLACLLLVFLPSWYFLRDWGNHGLWMAFTLFSVARGLSLGMTFWYLADRQQWIPTGAPGIFR